MTRRIWAVVPVKETAAAKQRLAARLPAPARQELALAMVEHVLEALAQVRELAGVIVVTVDPAVVALAGRYGGIVSDAGAHDGHTGAVVTTGRRLAAEGHGMLTVPGDLPLLAPADIRQVLAAHGPAPAFTIVPARDLLGSNCIVMTPADAVPLRFGDDSYYPHLAAADAAGIAPTVVRCPGIELDIDTPEDLAAFETSAGDSRTHRLLARWQAGAKDRRA
jgi:2-phospho-L-lactate guanylyltransferase